MNKILSIGTIVKVRGMYDGVNLMIIGYFPIEKETEKIFDYSVILYPQGLVGERSVFLFFDEDIEDIIFEGYSDDESEEFRKALPMLLEKMAEFEENWF